MAALCAGLLLLLTPHGAAAAGAADLSGSWILTGQQEQYSIVHGSTAVEWNVTCVRDPCTAWHTALITSSATDASLSIAFDSGYKDSGTVEAAGTSMAWADGSSWGRQRPGGTPITVHVCPSTHMDPGWFNTVDELYETLFRATITNVMAALPANPARTFVAEIAVIWAMFIGEGNATAREALRALVASGQLEFTGGGWVQPDEAITRFEDLVDQQTLGHMFTASVLDHKPIRVGWAADPFGHGNTFAYINALNAYDAHVLGRPMSPHDPVNGLSSSLWHPMSSLPDAGSFDGASTVMTYDNQGYWQPYRSMNGDLNAGNTTPAAATLLAYAQAAAGRAPYAQNVLVMLGDDAPMQPGWAHMYPALDAVLAALNAQSGATNATFVYSTPSRWVAALAAEGAAGGPAPMPARPAWDMLPLVGNEFPYWTGYYTSRPEFKQVYHDGSAFFRGASALHALARDERTWAGGVGALLSLWRAVGLSQHHDIITGDCFDNVAEDNALRVRTGVSAAAAVASEAAAALLGTDGGDAGAACTNLTLAPCAAVVAGLEAFSPVTLTLFNPLAWPRGAAVSLIVPTSDVITVTDAATGSVLPSQLEAYAAPDLPFANWSTLVFTPAPPGVPALGAAAFILQASSASAANKVAATAQRKDRAAAAAGPITLANAHLSASFSPNGTLAALTALPGGAAIAVTAKVLKYTSTKGSENAWSFSTDGSTDAVDFAGAATQTVAWLTQGPVFSELTVAVDAAEGVSLRYRLYADEAALHVFVGSGPFASNDSSTDSILRLETDIASGGQWWTDANGLELQPRNRWARPFAPGVNYSGFAGNEPVAINQYPMTALAVLADAAAPAAKPALAVVTANSHAATSMVDGSLELTLNRNVLDGSGARKTGNRLVTQHLLLLPGPSRAAVTTAARPLSASLSNPPLAFAAAGTDPGGAIPAFAPLAAPLPPQLALVSLQLLPAGFNLSAYFVGGPEADATAAPPPVSSAALLLRLRHVFQAGGVDDPALAVPASVDLAVALAPRWAVTTVTELTVDASQPLAAARAAQVQWPQAAGAAALSAAAAVSAPKPAVLLLPGATAVTLAPMELRTYLLTLQ